MLLQLRAARAAMEQLNFGLIGGGTVGSGVWHHWRRNGALLESRLGLRVRLRKVAVKSLDEPRPYPIPASRMTTDWRKVVEDRQIHAVIELVGGTTVAKTMILTALRLGKPVITANKALLSAHGEELFAAARQHGANLYYEASVGGGIPIIKALREGFVGNRISHIYGIVNGTCNYILTRMKLEHAEFAPTLAEAQKMGIAEADPAMDVDGLDSMHKTGILASLAHGFWVEPASISVEGIRAISRTDIEFAEKLGYTIKLLGVIKVVPAGAAVRGAGPGGGAHSIQVSVYPCLVPNTHVLAGVNDVFNAIFVRGDVVGDTLFYGRGAGKDATTSAVLSDIADAALDLKHGTKNRVPAFVPHGHGGDLLPAARAVSRYYVRVSVADKPGMLARIAAILAEGKIGIASVIQPEGHEGGVVPLILMTHAAPYAAMKHALQRIGRTPAVKAPPIMLRVESFEP
ncbi:MAG TPA: homoserine dehydrogenase [Candidatus Acidoferrum sp.]|nr:homoserine dehydrogenase [Candidatus Acidoferrum sp.]